MLYCFIGESEAKEKNNKNKIIAASIKFCVFVALINFDIIIIMVVLRLVNMCWRGDYDRRRYVSYFHVNNKINLLKTTCTIP